MSEKAIDLIVKGESIENLYRNYLQNKYIVNRRYQRKLVWSKTEKSSFVDSLIRTFPVPLILLAEVSYSQKVAYEIIDGLQRLEAIFSFIENQYDLDGRFFDLNSIAATKELLDSGKLTQNTPTLPRGECVILASYNVPLSIFDSGSEEDVDNIFRRINSGGKKLSRQELRMAGSTGHFSSVVRRCATEIRGDVTNSDVLQLNIMKTVSITNRDLPYGIKVEDVFWVKNGILTKEQVRESRDEEILSDIISYVLFNNKPPSRSDYLDDLFGFSETESAAKKSAEIDNLVQKITPDVIVNNINKIIDQFNTITSNSGKSLKDILFTGKAKPAKAPRYFQVIFLSLYELVVNKNKELTNMAGIIKKLTGYSKNITITEGGKWGAEARKTQVDACTGVLDQYFTDNLNYDPSKTMWVTQLENILRQSDTEQAAYDFKQGFLSLNGKYLFDEESFEKILKTLSGISNIRNGIKGYVLVGIADCKADNDRVERLYNITSRNYEGFYIAGVDREPPKLEKSLDEFFNLIVEKINKSKLSNELRSYVSRNLKLVKYHDKHVFVLETRSQQDPSFYGNELFVRHGAQLKAIEPKDIPAFIKSWNDRR